MSHGFPDRPTPMFIAQVRAEAQETLMRILARGDKVGDINMGQPVQLNGTFTGPELEALMILMANAGIYVRPNRDAR